MILINKGKKLKKLLKTNFKIKVNLILFYR